MGVGAARNQMCVEWVKTASLGASYRELAGVISRRGSHIKYYWWSWVFLRLKFNSGNAEEEMDWWWSKFSEIRSDQEQKIKGIPHFLRQEAWRAWIYFGLGSRGKREVLWWKTVLSGQGSGGQGSGGIVMLMMERNGGRGRWWEFEIVAVENEKRKLIKTSKSIVELSDLMLQAQSSLPQ